MYVTFQSSSDESEDLGTTTRAAASGAETGGVKQNAILPTGAGSERSMHAVRHDKPRTEVIGRKKILIAQTPKGIRK